MEKIFGGWDKVPSNLKSKTELKKLGLEPTTGADFQVWNSYNWIPIYDISKTTPILPPTIEEKLALSVTRKIARQDKKDRTCSNCFAIVKYRASIIESLCPDCREEKELNEWLRDTSAQALVIFQNWFKNKQEYIILDTETTGLDCDAEIVEIGICNMDGHVLFESLVKPLRSIPSEVTEIHGIDDAMVFNSPSWPKVWAKIQPLLHNKTILIYNSQFDSGMIRNDCARHDLPIPDLTTECIMQTYAELQGSYSHYHKNHTWISLKDAIYGLDIQQIAHRAVGDCIACAELIRRIAKVRMNV